MTAGIPQWFRTALTQIYPPSPSSDALDDDLNACVSDDVKITVNGNSWTRDEFMIRAADVAPSEQTLRIGDLVVARPTPGDDSIGLVAASYEVIQQAQGSQTQYRIFASIIVDIDYDKKIKPSPHDDGRRIMTIDEERREGTIEYSQPKIEQGGRRK